MYFTAVYFLLDLTLFFIISKQIQSFYHCSYHSFILLYELKKKAFCLLYATLLEVWAVKECVFCNFKATSETPDFLCDLSAISLSHMDAVCPVEPYTRARPEGLQSVWFHKVLPISFTVRREKTQCHINPGLISCSPYLACLWASISSSKAST